MKTHRCHLLTCALFLLTCIQPVKAMEGSGPQQNGSALAGSFHHAPEAQEPAYMQTIRTDLAKFHALKVTPHDKSIMQLKKYGRLFSLRLFKQGAILGLTRTETLALDQNYYPILSAAAITYGHLIYMLELKKQRISFRAIQKLATLWIRLITSQEILEEIVKKRSKELL